MRDWRQEALCAFPVEHELSYTPDDAFAWEMVAEIERLHKAIWGWHIRPCQQTCDALQGIAEEIGAVKQLPSDDHYRRRTARTITTVE